MSEEEAVAAADEVCACCGIAAVDNITLKKCACNLIKYCSVECQKNHRPRHKKLCKKRMAELHDNNLLKQPDSSCYGECPICCLPLPVDMSKSAFMGCCSKLLCNGCQYANKKREFEAGLEHRCAFCREPVPESEEEYDKNVMERIKKNDPVAMDHMGKHHYHKGDFETALKYLTMAAELGDMDAHYNLSCMYRDGEGVEKDVKKAFYYLEKAAIGGHPDARLSLGVCEAKNRRLERARKHFIIAANLGHDESLKKLMQFYAHGLASKEDYANALRACQAAVDETKSAEREEAEEAIKNGKFWEF
jgi:tetratricopeptide (TPR) repeat protein